MAVVCGLGKFLQNVTISGNLIPSCKFCPGGTFGSSTGLLSSDCSGKCSEGYFCPAGSISNKEFLCGGSKYYCPAGSSESFIVEIGYYSIGGINESTRSSQVICEKGHYCANGIKIPCSLGTYGNTEGLSSSNCSGFCEKGYYCPIGSISQFQIPCPAGRFGDTFGLKNESCSGLCSPGHYCPKASISKHQNKCGDKKYYCPRGSSKPSRVLKGFYSVGLSEVTSTAQIKCEKGFYCYRGYRYICPAGSFGDLEGIDFQQTLLYSNSISSSYSNYSNEVVNEKLTELLPRPLKNFICSGLCEKGHYCPAGSISKFQIPCPAGNYGNVIGLKNNFCSGICPLGHFCPMGTSFPKKCKGGIFGNTFGLTNSSCSSICWNPNDNFTNKNENEDYGNYENDESENNICVSRLCSEGYYCPPGSTNSKQINCGGTNFYCPSGSSNPSIVSKGYYSTGGIDEFTRSNQTICEKGHYCKDGLKVPCPPGTYGDVEGLSSSNCSGLCFPGFYCPRGTVFPNQFPCPPGRFQSKYGQESNICEGECSEGFYCPLASVSEKQIQCSEIQNSFHTSNFENLENLENYENYEYDSFFEISLEKRVKNNFENNPNNFFCPKGSSNPSIVSKGYYSTGGNSTTRFSQTICEKGHYCKNGIKFFCPPGRYGSTVGLSNFNCSGFCEKGHYCPKGSFSRKQFPCPAGFYGSTEGLWNKNCSGPCHSFSDCEIGSVERKKISLTPSQ